MGQFIPNCAYKSKKVHKFLFWNNKIGWKWLMCETPILILPCYPSQLQQNHISLNRLHIQLHTGISRPSSYIFFKICFEKCPKSITGNGSGQVVEGITLVFPNLGMITLDKTCLANIRDTKNYTSLGGWDWNNSSRTRQKNQKYDNIKICQSNEK